MLASNRPTVNVWQLDQNLQVRRGHTCTGVSPPRAIGSWPKQGFAISQSGGKLISDRDVRLRDGPNRPLAPFEHGKWVMDHMFALNSPRSDKEGARLQLAP